MEKSEKKKSAKQSTESSNHMIWDCGSSLYDSFELKSFQKELDSALVSRTLSMPHLSDSRRPPPPPPPVNKKQASKISRSFQRLIRAVFRPKSSSITAKDSSSCDEKSEGGPFYVVYDRNPKISTIAEVPEFDELSPELRSIARRSASARFTSATSLGITCN